MDVDVGCVHMGMSGPMPGKLPAYRSCKDLRSQFPEELQLPRSVPVTRHPWPCFRLSQRGWARDAEAKLSRPVGRQGGKGSAGNLEGVIKFLSVAWSPPCKHVCFRRTVPGPPFRASARANNRQSVQLQLMRGRRRSFFEVLGRR